MDTLSQVSIGVILGEVLITGILFWLATRRIQ